MEKWNKGFSPIINAESKILILGSFPSVKSREVGFYYGNPQNRFWKTLKKALGKDIPEMPNEKEKFLLENKIALYDVIDKSNIKGSSDLDLKENNISVADIYSVIKKSNELKVIICNGKKSYNVLSENFNFDIPVICLPSTSSANPAFDEEKWINIITKYL